MVPRETVTEHRLDALERKVDEGFDRLEANSKARDEGLDRRFDEVNDRFDRLDARFEKMNDRFHALNRTLIAGAVATVVALIGSSATLAGIAFL
jgi:predicted nuclease with TOPRIM domain